MVKLAVFPQRRPSVMAGQEQDGERDEDDQQDGESGADGADKVAERPHIIDQFRMLGCIAFDALAQKRDLIFDPLHLDGLILHLEVEFPIVGMDFG